MRDRKQLPQKHTSVTGVCVTTSASLWSRFGDVGVHVWFTCTVLTAEWCKLHTPKPLASQELLYLNVFYVLCKLFMWEGK